MKFIYALNKEDKIKLLDMGFNFINEQQINNQTVYLFENKTNNVSTFYKQDEGRFLFSNKMFF